jgi:hypothetical protein
MLDCKEQEKKLNDEANGQNYMHEGDNSSFWNELIFSSSFSWQFNLYPYFQANTEILCGSLVVVVSFSIQEVVSSSPARAGRVKPKMFKVGSDCSFAKSTAFRSENHGSFGYDFKNGGPVSQ